jgi:nitrate reductase / nitrite oxidoreductase, alpha subunit
MSMTRRDFLKLVGGTTAALTASQLFASRLLQPVDVANPLSVYPDRSWEEIYRNQYRYDSSFTYVCSPNDTHACRMRAFVRNGVILRAETNYDVEKYSDLDGNSGHCPLAPARLQKGADLPPARLRTAPAARPHHAPGLEGVGRRRLPLPGCGQPGQVQIHRSRRRRHDPRHLGRSLRYMARGMIAIAAHYSGEEGRRAAARRRLPGEMIAAMQRRRDAHL